MGDWGLDGLGAGAAVDGVLIPTAYWAVRLTHDTPIAAGAPFGCCEIQLVRDAGRYLGRKGVGRERFSAFPDLQ